MDYIRTKKLLSILLSIMVIVSMMPVATFAFDKNTRRFYVEGEQPKVGDTQLKIHFNEDPLKDFTWLDIKYGGDGYYYYNISCDASANGTYTFNLPEPIPRAGLYNLKINAISQGDEWRTTYGYINCVVADNPSSNPYVGRWDLDYVVYDGTRYEAGEEVSGGAKLSSDAFYLEFMKGTTDDASFGNNAIQYDFKYAELNYVDSSKEKQKDIFAYFIDSSGLQIVEPSSGLENEDFEISGNSIHLKNLWIGYNYEEIVFTNPNFDPGSNPGGNGGGSGTGDESTPTPGTPTSVDVTKEVKVEKTETGSVEASVDLSSKVTDIVKSAKDSQSKEVVIDATAKTTENVSKADVTTTAKLFEDLSKVASVENLVIKTNVSEFTFDRNAVAEIASQVGDGTTLTVEAIRQDDKSDQISQDVYELKLVVDSGSTKYVISDFKGGKVTVKVLTPTGLIGKNVGCLYRNDKGVCKRMIIIDQNDKEKSFSFTTTHFSDYIVAEESAAQKILVNQTKVTQNKLKAYNGKKIRVSFKRATWDKELGKKITGYQIYRSTKKSKGFKKVATLTKKTSSTIKYFNKKGLKSGKKYYYKVRGKVKLSNGKYAYTKFSAVKSVKCK